MLQALRQNSKNAIIYVLFGVIIAVFIINFGPGSRGCEGVGGTSYAAKIGPTSVSDLEYRYTYIAMGFSQQPPQIARQLRLKEMVMDQLINRELLAEEAEKLGFQVSQKQVEEMVEDGRMYILGSRREVEMFKKDGVFDYDRFAAFCKNHLGVTVARFIEVQQRELMAEQVRQLIAAGTRVTPDEVKADYDLKNTQVNLDFVRFQPRVGDDDAEVTPAEIAAYRKTHEEDIKKAYEKNSYLYKKIDKHAHLRRILVNAAKDAPEADVKAAQAKIDDAAAKVKGGAPFADVAKQVSDEARTRARGGDLGWRKKGYTGLGDTLDDKVFAAKAGDVIGPDRTERGFELIKVEGFREGDVPLDQVADEIAEGELRQDRAKAKAKTEADDAAAKVKAGGKLAELFPKSAAPDSDETKKPGAGAQAEETGLFSRHGETVQSIGLSSELARRAFEGKQGDLLGPIEVGGAWVVATIKERKEPDKDFFDKHKDEELHRAEQEKWKDALGQWTQRRCVEARDEGRVKVNDEVLSYDAAPAKGLLEMKYEPCTPPGLGGGLRLQ